MTLFELDQVIKAIEQDIELQDVYKKEAAKIYDAIGIIHKQDYISINHELGISREISVVEMDMLINATNHPLVVELNNALNRWDDEIERLRESAKSDSQQGVLAEREDAENNESNPNVSFLDH